MLEGVDPRQKQYFIVGIYSRCDFQIQTLSNSIILSKMQSLNELNSSERGFNYPSTMPSPSYIEPKDLLTDQIEFEEIHDFNEAQPQQLPKFVSIKHMQNFQEHSAKFQQCPSSFIFREKAARYLVTSRIQQKPSIYEKQQEDRPLIVLLKSIMWMCYFISSAERDFQTLTLLSYINFIGIGIAFLMTLGKIIKRTQTDLQDLIHFISLVTTITLYLFSSFDDPESPFIAALIVIRSFRLFFPLNLNHNFKNLIIKYANILKKIARVCIPLLYLVTLFSLAFSEGAYSHIYNRCRLPSANETFNPPTDNILCGSRQCPLNSECLNPQTYNIIPDESQFREEGALAYGFFIFTNLYRATFSIFSLGSLSQSTIIIDIYVNSLPGYLLAGLSILVIIFIQFAFIPVLVVLIESRIGEEDCNQEQGLQPKLQQIQESIKESKNHSSAPTEVFNAAPTFGRINNETPSSKAVKKVKTRLTSLDSDKRISISGDMHEEQKTKSLKFAEIAEQTQEESHQNRSEGQTTCEPEKYYGQILTILKVTTAVVQFVLMLIFSIKITNQSINQTIGIGLCCLFIVWTFKIGLEVFSKYFDDESEAQTDDEINDAQNVQLIFKIQCFIYMTNFLDYFCRIMQGVYFMEEVSVLTPLATASLALRILYVPLISGNYPSFNTQLKIFAKMQNSIFVYVLFMVIVSSVIATFSMSLSSHPFPIEVVKHFAALANSNWVEIYHKISVNTGQDMSSDLAFAIKFFLIIVGELIMLKFIYSEAIFTGILSNRSYSVQLPELQLAQSPNYQDILSAVKSEKTFFLLSYESNSLRESLHKILQRNTYRNFKQRLVEAYLLISFLGEIFLKSSEILVYSLMTISCLLLMDAFITILALRFWGKYSFSNYHWYNIVNLIISFIIIANAATFFLDCAPLRSFRILLLLSMNKDLKEAFRLLANFFRVIVKTLPLLSILWAFFMIISVCITMEYHDEDKTEYLLKSISFGLQMFKKGFDLPSVLLIHNDYSKMFSLQSLIFTIMIGIPINCLCIVLILKYLQMQKKKEEDIQINEIRMQQSRRIGRSRASEELQKIKIKQQILSLTPKIDPAAFIQKGFFLKLVTKTQFFKSFKIVVLALSAILLVLLTLFKTTFSEEILLSLKIARTFFYLMEIFLFIIESIAFNCNSNHFKLTLGLYLLSFPGSFIMIVPYHKLAGSKDLKQLLLIFISMAPLSVINIFLSFSSQFTSLVSFIYKKLNRTCWLLFLILNLSWFFGSLLSLFLNEEMIVIMSKVLICFLGGTFQPILPKSEYTKYDQIYVYIIITIINFVTFPIKNGLIAMFLFEISDKIQQKSHLHNSNSISRSCIQTEFDQSKFMQTWFKLDPKGTGVLPYSVVFQNILHFIKSFKLYKRYLNFLVAPANELYDQKLQLFKELHLPVRTINVTDKEGNKKTQYMITIFDIAACFLCLALKEKDNNNLNQSDPKIVEEEQGQIFLEMGLDTEQWSQKVAVRIAEFNKYRREELEYGQKYVVLKSVDMESKFLGSIIKIFPALRRKMRQAKLKVKGQ